MPKQAVWFVGGLFVGPGPGRILEDFLVDIFDIFFAYPKKKGFKLYVTNWQVMFEYSLVRGIRTTTGRYLSAWSTCFFNDFAPMCQ